MTNGRKFKAVSRGRLTETKWMQMFTSEQQSDFGLVALTNQMAGVLTPLTTNGHVGGFIGWVSQPNMVPDLYHCLG